MIGLFSVLRIALICYFCFTLSRVFRSREFNSILFLCCCDLQRYIFHFRLLVLVATKGKDQGKNFMGEILISKIGHQGAQCNRKT